MRHPFRSSQYWLVLVIFQSHFLSKINRLSKWQIKEKNWFLINNLYGWSIPLLAFLIAVIVHIDSPSIGVNSCFFHSKLILHLIDRTFLNSNLKNFAGATEQWLFLYLPMSIMLTINLVFGIWTAVSLHQRGDDISPDRKKRLRFKWVSKS